MSATAAAELSDNKTTRVVVASWGPPEKPHATEVRVRAGGADESMELRFATPSALDWFINKLIDHRHDVWGSK